MCLQSRRTPVPSSTFRSLSPARSAVQSPPPAAIEIILLVFVLIFRCELAQAQDPAVLQGARREGRVVWYSVAGESQQIAQEFEKKYPFIKAEVVRSTVYPLLTRMLNEARGGNYLFDVVRQSTFTIGQLIQRGLIQPYDSPERKGFDAGWRDKRGTGRPPMTIIL